MHTGVGGKTGNGWVYLLHLGKHLSTSMLGGFSKCLLHCRTVWSDCLSLSQAPQLLQVEATTGRGTLQQVGLITPSLPLLATILALAGGAVTIGSFSTIFRATKSEMTAKYALLQQREC